MSAPSSAGTEPNVAGRLPGPAAFPSLPARLAANAAHDPTRVALRGKRLGHWQCYSWADYADQVRRLGLGLRALGVARGDRVAVHSDNRPEWLFADLAIQGIGAATVGVYPTSPAAEVRYLLDHSGSGVLIAEDEEQLDKALAVREHLPALRQMVVIDPRGVRCLDDPMVMTLAELLGLADSQPAADWDRLVAEIAHDDVATLVYTSGTTGPPKGAMITHGNLLAAARAVPEVFGGGPDDDVLSYLPLSHVFERLVSLVNGLTVRYVVNFGEGGEAFGEDLRDLQPTFFVGVPRIWEKMMAGISMKLADASPLKRRLAGYFLTRGRHSAGRRMERRATLADRLTYAIGWVLVYRPLRHQVGLSRVRVALSGAAPVSPRVLEFFWSMGVPVREGYGMTENTAIAACTRTDLVRPGTVGPAMPGVELTIAPDGEILTRSAGVFAGYLHDPEATAAVLDSDGWLHTGDVGTVDPDGFLRITDRKKDIIITGGGKNISPTEIENKLKVSPYVREAVVIGDGRKYLTALIGVEADTVGDWASRERIPYTTYADLSSRPEVHALVDGWVEEVNSELASVETIKKFALLPKELDTEEGELTATQKVRRLAVERQFAGLIDGLYGGSG